MALSPRKASLHPKLPSLPLESCRERSHCKTRSNPCKNHFCTPRNPLAREGSLPGRRRRSPAAGPPRPVRSRGASPGFTGLGGGFDISLSGVANPTQRAGRAPQHRPLPPRRCLRHPATRCAQRGRRLRRPSARPARGRGRPSARRPGSGRAWPRPIGCRARAGRGRRSSPRRTARSRAGARTGPAGRGLGGHLTWLPAVRAARGGAAPGAR